MKNILLFSRCELVHLYGRLNPYLSKSYNIIHLAFSKKEEDILKNKYHIEKIINFTNETEKILASEELNKNILNEIDRVFIEESQNRFCLNSAIRFDRTFRYLEYEKCLLLAQVYYRFWLEFFNDYKIDFMFHEPPAIFFTHIAANICKKYGIKYLIQTPVNGLDTFNWIFVEGDNSYPFELAKSFNFLSLSSDDRKEAQIFFKFI